MYGNSYFAPSDLCQNKATFPQFWEIIYLAVHCAVPHAFSAGPVLLLKPPCCQLGGSSAFGGHFFYAIPVEFAVRDQTGKFQFEKWPFRKNCCWMSACFLGINTVIHTGYLFRWGFFKVLVNPQQLNCISKSCSRQSQAVSLLKVVGACCLCPLLPSWLSYHKTLWFALLSTCSGSIQQCQTPHRYMKWYQ